MAGAGPLVQIESGRLRGVASASGTVSVFKGIPYAKPPVGELRWRAPQAIEPWPDVRAAEAFAHRCLQPDRHPMSISYFGPEPQSEDCLYLNIWTRGTSGERLPVMVWFHGGAFSVGSGALPIFNGEHLARKGAVIVTVNYRLGRLGFLAHPELTNESGTSGNYGLLDQIAALHWVQTNIAAFGGDKTCVTIFGQSAGSVSGSILMASPLTKGLFSRVIGQSGAYFGPVAESSNVGDSIQSLAAAERSGLAFGRAIGAHTLAELRARSGHEIQLMDRRSDADSGTTFDPTSASFDTKRPIIDGQVLPQSPYSIFAKGLQSDVPLLVGTNANEGATLPSNATLRAFTDQARAEHGKNAEEFLRLYPATTDAEAEEASRASLSYRVFYWQNWAWARLHARAGRSAVFSYRFSRASPIPPDANYAENSAEKFGAFHSAEIPFVYDNLAARDWPWREADHRLAETMSTYWLQFAATGNPNGGSLPQWPAFDSNRQMAMEFGDQVRVAPLKDVARLEFWDAYYAARRGE